MDDDKIISLYWKRSEVAITESIQKYSGYCMSIAMHIMKNIEYSEECVNDTWLKAWASIPPQRPTVLRLFLGAITRNLSLNKVRDLSRQKRGGKQAVIVLDELQECVPDNDTTEKLLEEKEITEAINRWLKTLNKEKRVAFLRRYWYCDNLVDVSSFMGWSESKTNSLLRRLRLSLKKYLIMEGIHYE